MKAILINPFEKTVTEIQLADGVDDILPSIYEAIDCQTIDYAEFRRLDSDEVPQHLHSTNETGDFVNNDLVIDDEGRFNAENKEFYLDREYQFVGKALIVGVNNFGETVGYVGNFENLKKRISFPEVENGAS